jgi:hypothetical protein
MKDFEGDIAFSLSDENGTELAANIKLRNATKLTTRKE